MQYMAAIFITPFVSHESDGSTGTVGNAILRRKSMKLLLGLGDGQGGMGSSRHLVLILQSFAEALVMLGSYGKRFFTRRIKLNENLFSGYGTTKHILKLVFRC